MSMSDHINQQVSHEFFCQIGVILLENGKTGFFCFNRVGEPAHISKICYLSGVEAAWYTVLICCIMCGTEQPKEQPQIGDRSSNPVAINQLINQSINQSINRFLIFFSLGSTCSRSLFHLLIFFISRSLLHLI